MWEPRDEADETDSLEDNKRSRGFYVEPHVLVCEPTLVKTTSVAHIKVEIIILFEADRQVCNDSEQVVDVQFFSNKPYLVLRHTGVALEPYSYVLVCCSSSSQWLTVQLPVFFSPSHRADVDEGTVLFTNGSTVLSSVTVVPKLG